jgi:hypothetical protein
MMGQALRKSDLEGADVTRFPIDAKTAIEKPIGKPRKVDFGG